MILNARITPQRFPRAFLCWTYVWFQVRGGATVFIAKEQGEAANQNDGIQLTQASTAPPWGTWIKGDMWYSSNVDNSQFVLEVIAQADESFHP